jgi:hypothetical protein
MDNKFFTFIKPYLSFIDKGNLYRKPFNWLYIALAALNLLYPLYFLYIVIEGGILHWAGAKEIFFFIFIWLVIAVAAWVSFQIWWDRKDKILNVTAEGADFPATPVISHFIQTFGEWFGTWFAIVGFGFSVFALIFFGMMDYRSSPFDLPIYPGIWGIILNPIIGFLIIVFSRFIAEQIRTLATIANNTKK